MIEKDEEGYIQDVSHISCLFFFHICAMKTVDYNNTLCQTKGFMVASFLRNPVLTNAKPTEQEFLQHSSFSIAGTVDIFDSFGRNGHEEQKKNAACLFCK